ncbi:MAG: hypothetical protein K9L82_06465 [Chromatiaceae bacterium]|nr:hypothetical protein [Chromatiaceae bacterium]MCF7993852.1 hypothetical protein [Chromatiaceae bacterium]MCF8003872.1 hypothetical protein [Chromatiaceae bacterium]MCF8017145.1 hypothetical protein [Chromatiaceae bacterium]
MSTVATATMNPPISGANIEPLNHAKSDLAGEKLRRDLGAAGEVVIEVRDAVAVLQAEGQWPDGWGDGTKAVHMLSACEGLIDAALGRVLDEYGDD